MHRKTYTYLLYVVFMMLLATTYSCQKENEVKDSAIAKSIGADSTNVSAIMSPGNLLASSGTLKVTIGDSTYVFDAAKDSIAFINVHTDDKTRYYGITAINKEHTVSFGISSLGFPVSNINSSVAGSQFILTHGGALVNTQYSLSQFSGQKDAGSISLVQFNQRRELAKGTFYTYLAKDDKAGSPYYKVEGVFDLQVK